nr:hypothetical protein BaRGS_025614 [Batillaria attramentaria]
MAAVPQRYALISLIAACLLLVPARTSDVKYSIKEELSQGTIFGYIVDDSDLRRKVSPDELGNLKFSFLTTGNPNSKYFHIEPRTGVLSVASRIDRETVCSFRPECELTVSAAVQSELGPFFILIQVHVQVTDVNDNPPTFSQQDFQITVPENAALGVTFPLPTAFDKDTGTNNTVRDYFLLSGYPTFSLQTSDELGNIQTALQLQTHLNREETSFMTIHATDADVGKNGNVSYGFSQQQPRDVLELFRMDALTGNMYLSRSAENHTGRIYELVVEASDQGAPPKVSRALVRVRVLDTVNSRPDIFVDILSAASGQAEVSEYAEVGKVVAYVSVRDPDSGENGVTVCRLNTKDFELQPLNNQGQYKVILVTNLDREKIWRYDISVGCTDFGFPPLENSANFVVIVRDENDNPPVFSQRKYITTIRENGTVGATIVQLTVTDLDVGRNSEVEYRVAGAYKDEFKILNNGTMIATAPLDRELSEKLVVKVLAVDKGFPPLSGSATVFVTLEDVNDQAPRFNDNRYSFSVAEDARPGSYVGIVGADDDDQGQNAEIVFMELPEEGTRGRSAFIITKEGVVKTNMPLDREVTPVHYFRVVAKDRGHPPLSSTTTVTIHVDDVNDNTPIFIYPTEGNDTISIPHTFPLQQAITRVAAKDLDMGRNQALVYSCASANDSGRLFGVNERTGDLMLHRRLSRSETGLYILRVAAHDEGTPQLSNQTLLYVDVYFDNSTLFDPSAATTPSRTVMTALILVGVVVVVGGVAVITLVCIKRAEAKKKADSNSLTQSPSKLQGGYYIAPGVCESPAFGGGLGNSGGLGKPIPEQAGGSGDGIVDVTNMRTVNPYVIMPPHSNYSDAEGPPESDDLADEEKRGADDTLSLSELSCQSTSDSGRGGSEFDVNNAANKDRGHVPSNHRRHVPDYVNAYSDLDSGDDTRNGGEGEPTEDDFLLPPYPAVLEEGDGEEAEGEVSERSALNFVPGLTNLSRSTNHDDSYVVRHQSEV